jgi:lysophospholipase L1-like esterase
MLIWNDGTWVVVNEEIEWEFNFSKYLNRYSCAYLNGEPDIVSILLGANDFQHKICTQRDRELYLSGIQTMIDSINDHNDNIKIIINLPVGGANQDAWGIRTGCNGNSEIYRHNIQIAGMDILKKWDNSICKENDILISPMLIGLDTENCFDIVREQVNKYCIKDVERQENWVHPNFDGNRQMGDFLAAVVQYVGNG